MRRISDDRAQAVLADWQNGLGSAPQLARLHGLGSSTVRSILKRNGVTLDPHFIPPRKTDAETDARIVARYLECHNSRTVGREFGVSAASVLNRVHEAGHPAGPKGLGKKMISPDQAAQIVKLRAQGLGVKAVGSQVGVDSRRVRRYLLENGHSVWDRPRRTKVLNVGGYLAQPVYDDDPLFVMANKRGYIPQHRYVMATSLGRLLDPSETVHHINGDRADNRLENLQMRQGRHGKGARFTCRDCGSHNVEATPLD